MRWLAIVIAVAGCGDDSAGPASTDEQLCEMMCSTLIGCGVGYDGNRCSSACLQQPIFRSCAKAVLSDCNALALCAFRQGSAESCNSAGGVPDGGDSCNQVQACQSHCNTFDQPASCGCACEAALSPAKAINLLINNVCSTAKCGTHCLPPTGNGPDCNACFASLCQTENAQCVNH
jgi:hypothetical protein